MVVRHIVLRHLSNVFDNLLADDVCPECFLKQHVAAIFFICQDTLDGCRCPFGFSENRFDLIFFQPVLQISQAGAALISLVEFTHDFCLFWYDAEFAICIFFVSIEPVARDFQCSDLCVHLLAAPDVAGDGFTFGLRHRTVHGDHKFTVRWKRVDILLLEENPNPKLPENASVIDAVERVAGKSLDGLCKDEVNLFLFALTDHPQKLCTLFRGRASDAFICKNPSHCPFLVGHDLVRIILALRFIATGLFFFLGRDAAVRRNAKLLCDRGRLL